MKDKKLKVIEEKVKQAEESLVKKDFLNAVKTYKDALLDVPAPRAEYDITSEILFGIGEAHFFNGSYKKAYNAYMDSFNAGDGLENPLTYLRLGQIFLDTQTSEKDATDNLLKAYMLGGKSVFEENSPPKYFEFLQSKVTLK